MQTLPPCGVVARLQITGLNFVFTLSILPFTNTTLTDEAGLPEDRLEPLFLASQGLIIFHLAAYAGESMV